MKKYSLLMNKMFILLMATTLCCGLASCSKEEDDDNGIKNSSSNSDSSSGTSQSDDIIGTWIDIDEANQILGSFASADFHISQGGYEKAKDELYEEGVSGLIITRNSIQGFYLMVNRTHKSGLTTLKTLNFPDGTRYYLEQELESLGSYQFMAEDYFETKGYSYFEVIRGDDGSVNYLLQHDSESYGDMSKFFLNGLSEYSWVR